MYRWKISPQAEECKRIFKMFKMKKTHSVADKVANFLPQRLNYSYNFIVVKISSSNELMFTAKYELSKSDWKDELVERFKYDTAEFMKTGSSSYTLELSLFGGVEDCTTLPKFE